MRLNRNLLRCGWAALRARCGSAYRHPVGVYFNLTPRCNSACRYCNFAALAASSPELPTAVALRYVREMAAAGVCRLNLTGGEPLLYPGLPEVIAAARAAGMFVVVASNGQAGAAVAEQLRCANLVMLSYDGAATAHDAVRGPGSHARVLAAMQALQAQGRPFTLTTVLARHNLGEIGHVLATAAQFGTCANFTLINVLPTETSCNHIPAAAAVADLLPEPAAVRMVCVDLLRRKRAGEPVGSSRRYLELLRDWPDYRKLQLAGMPGFTCLAGRLYAHLYYDGVLYPCGQWFGSGHGVALHGLTFAEVFARLPLPADCGACRTACDAENSYIYRLQPDALANWFRYLPGRSWRGREPACPPRGRR